ncbi:hypothetical protein IJ843_02450 [bacterium]|nr:hypothetical protein [bacterium]
MLSATFKMQYDQCRKDYNALSFEQDVNLRGLESIKARMTCKQSQAEQEATAQWNGTYDAYISQGLSESDAKKATRQSIGCSSDSLSNYIKEVQANERRDADYRQLAAYEQLYETRKDTIDQELEDLENEMKVFQEQHTKGIQEQTTFACFGGG